MDSSRTRYRKEKNVGEGLCPTVDWPWLNEKNIIKNSHVENIHMQLPTTPSCHVTVFGINLKSLHSRSNTHCNKIHKTTQSIFIIYILVIGCPNQICISLILQYSCC